MFHLLLVILLSMELKAQNLDTMNHQNETKGAGLIIRKGKLIYTEILINASAEKVWKVFTNFDQYSDWNPFIKSLKGIPKEGGSIEVFLQPPGNKGMTFQPRVLKFEANKEFRWIGKFILPRLFDGEHSFLLKDNKDGTCTFIQYERFRGILIPFLKSMLDKDTKAGFEQMNLALKKRCE